MQYVESEWLPRSSWYYTAPQKFDTLSYQDSMLHIKYRRSWSAIWQFGAPGRYDLFVKSSPSAYNTYEYNSGGGVVVRIGTVYDWKMFFDNINLRIIPFDVDIGAGEKISVRTGVDRWFDKISSLNSQSGKLVRKAS